MTLFTQFQVTQPQKSNIKIQQILNFFKTKLSRQHALMTYQKENTAPMQRILILGSSGSGKSTLARQLGGKLNLDVIHLDKHYWHPGWQPTPERDWKNKVSKLIQGDSWIIDGNYRSTLNMRIRAADTIIFLDLPPTICAGRAIKRRFMYLNHPRPDISRGCKERLFDPKFPKFVRWILDYPNRARPDVIRRLAQYGEGKQIVWLQSTQEVQEFLDGPPVTVHTKGMSALGSSINDAVIPQITTD